MDKLWLSKSKQNIVKAWLNYARIATDAFPTGTLRKDPIVIDVFDHVNRSEAEKYLNIASSLPPDMFLEAKNALVEWDALTGGTPDIDGISLTSTKYLGTLGKLWKEFGKTLYEFECWHEIGGGFGGLAYVLKTVFSDSRVYVYDLPEISALQRKIFHLLKSDIVTLAYTTGLSNSDSGKSFVVSEHAWSECPDTVRRVYAKSVISKCCAGWLTNNFGTFTSSTKKNCIETLKSIGKEPIESDTFVSNSSYTLYWNMPE